MASKNDEEDETAVLRVADAVQANLADETALSDLLKLVQELTGSVNVNYRRHIQKIRTKHALNPQHVGLCIAASASMNPLWSSWFLGYAASLARAEPTEPAAIIRLAESKLNEYSKLIPLHQVSNGVESLFSHCVRSLAKFLASDSIDSRAISALPSAILEAALFQIEESKIPITTKVLRPFLLHGGRVNFNEINFFPAPLTLADLCALLATASLSEISIGYQLVWTKSSIFESITSSPSCQILTKLDLAGAQHVSLPGLAKLSFQCRHLSELSLRQCTFETAIDPQKSQQFWPYFSEPAEAPIECNFNKLLSLDLSETEIFSTQLRQLLESCNALECLNVSRCQCLQSISFLPELCPNLRVIDVSFSFRISGFIPQPTFELVVALGGLHRLFPRSFAAEARSPIVVMDHHAAKYLSNGTLASVSLPVPIECGESSWNLYRAAAQEAGNMKHVGVETTIISQKIEDPVQRHKDADLLDKLDVVDFEISCFIMLPEDESGFIKLDEGDASLQKSIYDNVKHAFALQAEEYHSENAHPNPVAWFSRPVTRRTRLVLKIKKNFASFDLGRNGVGFSNAKLAECLLVAFQLLKIIAYDHRYVECMYCIGDGIFGYYCGS